MKNLPEGAFVHIGAASETPARETPAAAEWCRRVPRDQCKHDGDIKHVLSVATIEGVIALGNGDASEVTSREWFCAQCDAPLPPPEGSQGQ